MRTYEYYIDKMKKELKEINCENVVNWCKKELKKNYNETKLTQLEIARDEILNKI